MPRLIWTPRATRDVQRLYRFLARRNPDAGRRAALAIRSGVGILEQQPLAGRQAEEMEPEFREWIIDFGRDGYVVLYRLEKADVVLLAVRHGRESGYRRRVESETVEEP